MPLSRDRWDRDSEPRSRAKAARSGAQALLRTARRTRGPSSRSAGWPERHPGLVRRIAGAGHEIASHGWWHRKVTSLTPGAFREDLRASKAVLEDVSGLRVLGFRAPSFSIRPGMEWAFDALLEEGYEYDSSLLPDPSSRLWLARRSDFCSPHPTHRRHAPRAAPGHDCDRGHSGAGGRWRLPSPDALRPDHAGLQGMRSAGRGGRLLHPPVGARPRPAAARPAVDHPGAALPGPGS